MSTDNRRQTLSNVRDAFLSNLRQNSSAEAKRLIQEVGAFASDTKQRLQRTLNESARPPRFSPECRLYLLFID